MSNAQIGIEWLDENYPKRKDWRADIRAKRPYRNSLDVSHTLSCPFALLSESGFFEDGLKQFCPMPWNSWWWWPSTKSEYRRSWAVSCGFYGEEDEYPELTEEFRDAIYGPELEEAA
jgi:hypothetical protein